MNESTGVVWKKTYDSLKKKWRLRWILTNCFYLLLVVLLGTTLLTKKVSYDVFLVNDQSLVLETFKLKSTIYDVLRNKGISLGQGMDIAQAIVEQCKHLNLPPGLVLAVMKGESEFAPNAKSSKGAMGIMQIMPATFEDYAKKLRLGVSTQAAWDPLVNIKVATHILKDLYDTYKVKHPTNETEVWKLTLSAYNAGPGGGIPPKYVKEINKIEKEMNKKIMKGVEPKYVKYEMDKKMK